MQKNNQKKIGALGITGFKEKSTLKKTTNQVKISDYVPDRKIEIDVLMHAAMAEY